MNIVDELCICRHLRSEHEDTVQRGHGACTKCICPKFTWHSFLYGTLEKKSVCEYEFGGNTGKPKREIPAKYASATYQSTAEDAIKALNAQTDPQKLLGQWAVSDPEVDRVWMVFTQYANKKLTNGDLPGWDVDIVYLGSSGGTVDFSTSDETSKAIRRYAPYEVKELALKEHTNEDGTWMASPQPGETQTNISIKTDKEKREDDEQAAVRAT
jgi:hypothetical protein